tara:strand:+ start:368 stop:715 length:348 start_codon:yes stop_codon:yes gene_type:complete
MKSDEQQLQLQNKGLLRLRTFTVKNDIIQGTKLTIARILNIVLRSKLTIAQSYGAALRRIQNTLFHGEHAADCALRDVIANIREEDPKSAHLATLNRIHDQLQDARNITKGENYE